MKKHKYTLQKSNIQLDWYELMELKFALAKAIRQSIELEKELGLYPKYFGSTRKLIDIYKQVIKRFKEY